jgi:EAL domain-containing protein (putative c-di-GMP-specific phosphodiesterase class I)
VTVAALRVLVAEDDDDMRAALVTLIQSEASFELVGAAADAAEAVKLAASSRPDVALVDVRMPQGGGTAAAIGIRKSSPDTKVIALSAHDDRSTVLRMLQAGAVGYLVKGVRVDEIIDAIKTVKEGQGTLSVEVTSDVISELVGQLAVRTRAREQERRRFRRIRRALDEESAFSMAYQPIFELESGAVVGAEALARFQHAPRRGPLQWFAEAAEVGLGDKLEIAAVQKAVGALDNLPAGAFLSVNISPDTLGMPALDDVIFETVPGRLVAEVTEHARISDYGKLDRALAPLRERGIRLAVDDAGAGFASLRHILRLDPDFIKLDRTLIDGIDGDRSKQALAAGLISFAAKSGATIIAEGIERPDEVETLVGLGVSYGQGHHLARPAPLPLGAARTL